MPINKRISAVMKKRSDVDASAWHICNKIKANTKVTAVDRRWQKDMKAEEAFLKLRKI